MWFLLSVPEGLELCAGLGLGARLEDHQGQDADDDKAVDSNHITSL